MKRLSVFLQIPETTEPVEFRKSLLLASIALLLPLSRALAGLAVAAAILHELFFLAVSLHKGRKPLIRFSVPLKASMLLFALYFVSLFYADDFIFSWHKLETKLCLLFCPLLFGLNYSPSAGRYIPKAFILGNLLAVLYSLGAAGLDTFSTGVNHFHYMKLSAYLHLHPTVFSLYLFVSLFFLLDEWARSGEFKWTFLLPRLVVAILFLVFILLLSARMAMMSGFLLLGIYLFRLLYVRKGFLRSFGWMLLALALSSVAAWSIPSTRYRLQVLLQGEEHGKKEPNVRWEIWDAATQLAAKAPFWGYGLGDVDTLLVRKYEELDYCKPYGERYNAHNQFLQTLLATGWPGLFVFLSMLFLSLCRHFPKGKIELSAQRGKIVTRQQPFQSGGRLPALFFMLLLSINFLTESLLETQQSLIFFALFYSYFTFCD